MVVTANKNEYDAEEIYSDVLDDFKKELEEYRNELKLTEVKELKLYLKKEAYGFKIKAESHKKKYIKQIEGIPEVAKSLKDNIAITKDAIEYLKDNREALLRNLNEKLSK